ncbi:tonB family C-terminal domain protein [Bordetella holmesii 30539]|uniref:TonB protein, C-terminal domain protein n=2 Tax=Bordetella holmesii TaxID=35814 RepID=A0A158M7C5_9BORD|nr:tonB family C-terminal domain protein [Bordetella holmesii ATCC 51541]AIT26629.1 tonB family C-terminal domain protein [Bordetella holmesii 44057]EWM43855.1 tonB family C-terminal domain protein [Bordetella holmesii 41130]EWM47213.1 tonB family C-terminal domain protein [Bordetella holmesii 35009]EWM51369.1 tonB family C-terminal domain protein [Bordetella holmesii 70147]EXF88627.1 tonB family C-terminal domain protein [Bordetella holmesii 30539]EXX96450.1 tonB family C-terminal domain pro
MSDRRYLLVAIAISLLVHAGLLAWRFTAPPLRRSPAASLEITLVNAHTDTAPLRAQVLAQAAVDGGGNALAGVASTPLPRTADSPDTIVLQAMRKRQAQLEAEQARLLTQLAAAAAAGAPREPVHPWDETQDPGDSVEDQAGTVQNAQVATLAHRVQAYSALPRKTFVAPAAQASPHAAYLDAWRTRIETIGTQHFPAQARGRVYGSLRITVSIRPDGSLAGFDIDQPSPHAVLNQAARRIVQMAAPFAPFPPELARDTDVLVITRTWHFVNDTLETSAP